MDTLRPLPDPDSAVRTIRVQDHNGAYRSHDNSRPDMATGGLTWADVWGNPPHDGVQEFVPGYGGGFRWEALHDGPLQADG